MHRTYLLYSIFLPPSGFYGGFFDLPLWTVSYEIAFYIIYGFIINLVLKYGIKRAMLITTFILGVLFSWYSIFMQPDDTSFFNAIYSFSSNLPCWNFLGFLFVWFLGVGCFYFTKNFKCRVYLYVGLATILTINIVLFLHYICDIPFVYNPYPALTDDSCPSFSIFMTLAYSLPMLIFVYWLQFLKLPKCLIFISILGKKYSYTLYASHFILLNFTFGLLSPYLNKCNSWDFAILFMILFILANIIAFYLAKVLENRDLWIKLYDSLFKEKSLK
ncbi:acyltransferase family protein [Francisella philomiragia]|uniref:acyltransferase family protein n=1 Tax=Francisella philomiragia TaxID=28110 RepID=UPI0035142104